MYSIVECLEKCKYMIVRVSCIHACLTTDDVTLLVVIRITYIQQKIGRQGGRQAGRGEGIIHIQLPYSIYYTKNKEGMVEGDGNTAQHFINSLLCTCSELYLLRAERAVSGGESIGKIVQHWMKTLLMVTYTRWNNNELINEGALTIEGWWGGGL